MNPSYGQFCAMARTLEVVGERWTLLVVRELLCGSTGFNQIRRGVPAISRDTLAKRLRTLCSAGVVDQHGEGTGTSYTLTSAGQALGPVLIELASWTLEWDTTGLQPEHLSADVLFWDLHRRVDYRNVPSGRTVVEFRLQDEPNERLLWLMIGEHGTEICTTNGGYDPQLYITSTTEALSRWWLGDLDWSEAIRSDRLQTHGDKQLQSKFPTWFLGYALKRPVA